MICDYVLNPLQSLAGTVEGLWGMKYEASWMYFNTIEEDQA